MKITVFWIAVLSLLAGVAVERVWHPSERIVANDRATAPMGEAEKKILYWVAPMDPNYRRDGPGKSPMGMDLIPVHEGDGPGSEDDPSVVTISPAVVNNMGVRTARARRQDLRRRIETVGYIDYDESRIAHIHLRTDGWIERLMVKSVGERVRKGQLLFEFYSPTLVNAQAELLQAYRADRRPLIEASWARLRALDISEDQMTALVETGQIAELVKFFAPQDGVVAELNVAQGMYVKPSTSIMTLADLSTVWLLADVFERQSDWIELDQPAEVRLSYLPGRLWQGQVEYIYPALDAKTRSLKVRLEFDNPGEELKPAMYADVVIEGPAKPGVLTIPREALIRTGRSERVVLALGEGRFRSVEVVSGMESGGSVEILEGLDEGDEIVVSAQFLIDSESSLKASFIRMDEPKPSREMASMEVAQADTGEAIEGVGVVNEVMAGHRKVTLTHEPIPAISWPTMTMGFDVAEDVDLTALKVGDRIRFTLGEVGVGMYRILSVRPAD